MNGILKFELRFLDVPIENKPNILKDVSYIQRRVGNKSFEMSVVLI